MFLFFWDTKENENERGKKHMKIREWINPYYENTEKKVMQHGKL